jgi:hypothetical protein
MYNDADIETAELEASARHHAALRKRGICTHGWTQGNVDANGTPKSGTCTKCLDCGRIFPNDDALEHSRVMADVEGVIV